MIIRGLLCIILLLLPEQALATGSLPQIWSASKAVAYALENSPDSQVAAARIGEAEARLWQTKAAFYPQLGLGGGYSQTNNPMYSFGNILTHGQFSPSVDFNDPGRSDNLNLTAGLQYRLYNGGRDQAHEQGADAGVAVTQAERQAVHVQLGFEVFRSFQHIQDSKNIMRARQASLAAIRSSLQVAKARFDAGDLLKVNLLNLEVQESRFQENLIRAEHDLALAKEVFLQLLGLPRQDVDISPNQAALLAPASLDLEGHPKLQSLAAAIKAVKSEVEAARGGERPTVDGFASYQYDKGTVYGGSGNSWIAGVKVDFKVFDGHKSDSDIALAEAKVGVLRARKHKLELALGLDFTRAQLDLEQARQRRQVTGKMVEQALESESLSKAQFRAGVLLSSDLIDSENRLTGAKVSNILAASAVELAIADLRRAAGLAIFSDTLSSNSTMEKKP